MTEKELQAHKLYTVAKTSRSYMTEHGLDDWIFRFDNAKRRAGCCQYSKKTITLSYEFVLRNNEIEIRDTILHEIAHALAGPRAKHGPLWKEMCKRIGARPVRCYSNNVNMPQGKYKAVCGGCNKVFFRHRNIRRKVSKVYCSACGPKRGILTYRITQEKEHSHVE